MSLFYSFFTLLILVSTHEQAKAQCIGGNNSNFICGTDQSTSFEGSDEFGFDSNLVLLPASINQNPLAGPCFVCPDGTISATSGSYTDSFLGEVRDPGMANKGDLAQSPEEQGIILPTDPEGDGTIPMISFSLPLPDFSIVQFIYTDSDVFTIDFDGNGIGPIVADPLPPAEPFSFTFSGPVFAASDGGNNPVNSGLGNNGGNGGNGGNIGCGNNCGNNGGGNGIPGSNPFNPADIDFNFNGPGFGVGSGFPTTSP